MMNSQHVIVIGSGHLAFQIKKKLIALKCDVRHITPAELDGINSLGQSSFEHVREILNRAGLEHARAAYVVDDEDRRNIQIALFLIALNENIPVVVSLSNQNIAPHFHTTHKNLYIKNLASIAAPSFVSAIYASAPLTAIKPVLNPLLVVRKRFTEIRAHAWVYGALVAFLSLLIGGTIFFRWSEHLSWLNAFYFATTVITTTGFGDISLYHSSALAKLFGILLMLSALGGASLTFSLIVDRLLERQSAMTLGKRRYRFQNHVILCGLGRLGYQIVEELLQKGEQVLVIEKNPENRFLDVARSRGAYVFVADASIPQNLDDAGVARAKGLFSVINDDLKNLEIGLNARSLRPDLHLVLRTFDREMAEEIRKRFNIQFALSASSIATDEFVQHATASFP